ncbi:hypothetical protein HY498_03620 [Candidatus Woesearchaeota archaeon]|nr:hypothetical protein [Candidatus Woesearchaeota archaeon]
MKKSILIITAFFVLILLQGCFNFRDCREDLACFKESLKNCERSIVSVEQEGIFMEAIIKGESDNLCRISFKINKVEGKVHEEFPVETNAAIGKRLNCNLNISTYTEDRTFDEITKNYGICNGPLKDAMLSLSRDEVLRKEFENKLTNFLLM